MARKKTTEEQATEQTTDKKPRQTRPRKPKAKVSVEPLTPAKPDTELQTEDDVIEVNDEPLTTSGNEAPDAENADEIRVNEEPLTTSVETLEEEQQPAQDLQQQAVWASPWGDNITSDEWLRCTQAVWEAYKAGQFGKPLTHSAEPLPKMPLFKGDIKNPSSVVLNRALKKMALEKAKEDTLYPSGRALGISGLVEWLLWQYVGSPIELKEYPPEEESPKKAKPKKGKSEKKKLTSSRGGGKPKTTVRGKTPRKK